MAIEPQSPGARSAGELQAELDRAVPGSVIQLGPGRTTGPLVIERPVILRGAGAEHTILDGAGRGPTIAVDAPGEVRIEGLAITGGRGALGGGISIDNGARVFLVGCLLEGNAAPAGRGGAIAVDLGALYVAECTIARNHALLGGAIAIGGEAQAEIAATIIADNEAARGGGLAVLEGAALEVLTCRLLANHGTVEGHHLYVAGTANRRPMVLLSNAVLAGAGAAGLPIANHPRFGGTVAVDNSMTGRVRGPARLRA